MCVDEHWLLVVALCVRMYEHVVPPMPSAAVCVRVGRDSDTLVRLDLVVAAEGQNEQQQRCEAHRAVEGPDGVFD